MISKDLLIKKKYRYDYGEEAEKVIIKKKKRGASPSRSEMWHESRGLQPEIGRVSRGSIGAINQQQR